MYRVDKFRQRFEGAALIDDSKNIYYLTGYTGEGCLLITPRRAVIITDFRYVEQCERQAPECALEMTKVGSARETIVKRILDEEKISELFVETGVLTVNAFRRLQKGLEGVTLSDLPGVIGDMRIVKEPMELDIISKAVAISCEAFEKMLGQLKPGITEKQARAILEHELNLAGAEGLAFDTIVASGVNGSLPHAIPSDKLLKEGELITFDFGAAYQGYCSDCTRTVAMGKISQELKDIYDTVYTAHMNALSAVKPGMVCRDIDAIARTYIDKLYPDCFGHGLGHGVGINIHETPTVNTRGETTLVPGHVITIEPGVYIKGLGGCRIEDTVYVTEEGYFDPYTISKQLTVV